MVKVSYIIAVIMAIAAAVTMWRSQQSLPAPSTKPSSSSSSSSLASQSSGRTVAEPPKGVKDVPYKLVGPPNLKITPASATDARGVRLFGSEELAEYGNKDDGKPIYLAILGDVFDVSKAPQYYGKDGGYVFFTGRDGSRAFVSGQFDDAGLTDELDGLKLHEYTGIRDWNKFYHKDYTFIGRLCGRFYDAYGEKTRAWHDIQAAFDRADKQKEVEERAKQKFPPCNSAWSSEAGGEVWCAPKSGGVERDWAGYPRQMDVEGVWKCVCVREDQVGLHPEMKPYPNCDLRGARCPIPQ